MITLLKDLLKSRSGASAIEFSFVAPVMIFFFIGSVAVFDMFRTYQNIVEANGVVADVISRQTSIDATFVSNIYGVFTNLQQNSTAPSALRISSIKKTAGVYKLDWKKESGTVSLLKAQVLDSSTLPQITDGDSIIYVEGATTYTMLSNILGFGQMTFAERAFTRPRFISAVAFN
ncbi:pilus assembly protein [Rhizobium sp. BE258]|jgi:Flp pilus assembly protein TadG|uniref:TadE/TadG family type IV pilus assembly protein n=1 Tax=Rhizobium sp. BE258 TaxID=2817722 RepID=UPI0028580BD2|nr:pilus assembly protein [Rhizobium sp. BE258]MDR7143237.1 Flp pilus assembly protein TadG [Rhizobium sp. BE258]